ncbi:MAG: DNA polymerase III subunit beta [Deltaproteobacteria bacterium]|nr:DNA polymerase III subunit beta [Deltaproteobacteria bacterium]
MKFTIDKSEFLKTLQRMQGIVERRNTMPILSNVLMEANNGRVDITATDLEVFIKDSTQADVSENGSITVNARKLFDIIKEMKEKPEETISVVAGKDDRVTIKLGKARFTVMGLPAKDFPAFPTYEEKSFDDIDGPVFKEMIDKTAFAVSTDETRYNINGFKLERERSKLRLVTTDGHRLAYIERGDEKGSKKGEKIDVLVPRKGMMEFKRLLDEAGDEYKISITQKSAIMKKDNTIINIRLLEGEFPDYSKVIPKDNDKDILINKEAFLSSLKSVSIISPDKIKGVKMLFGDGKLVISSSSPDIGEAVEEIDSDYKGEELEVAFNARYFIDALEAMEEETIMIRLKDSLSPGILQPAGRQDYTYIVMPMRL